MPLLPVGAAIDDPLFCRRQHAGVEPAGADAADLLAPDQPAVLQRPQVLHHRGQAHLQRHGQLADRRGSRRQPRQHFAAGRIGKGLERAIEASRILKHVLNYRGMGGESR